MLARLVSEYIVAPNYRRCRRWRVLAAGTTLPPPKICLVANINRRCRRQAHVGDGRQTMGAVTDGSLSLRVRRYPENLPE